ncbi:hypothetical protein C2869_19695 [Saccharobesus litoralis]|uniref:Duplicated orphan permease n=1 Tax=Saccharobesus litoralis TaxID=2172099 RepID=A0A2S0VW88_9ALTE|nr:ADOP family duplicated permease [Saccharobesus litoralis]AWB68487.1 hypothetical protein C2869_19695 [Saccharobesus litoralis]
MNSWIDFKYAVRLLMQKPAFAVMTIMIMAIGLGLSIYNYSFIYSLSLRPVPLPQGERIVVVNMEINGLMDQGSVWDTLAFREMAEEQTSFEHFSYYQDDNMNISGGDRASRYKGLKTRQDLFEITSTQPSLGRTFNEQDYVQGAQDVAIISHLMWQDYFAGQQDIIGKSFYVNGTLTEVVGVMPEHFSFPFNQDLWIPVRHNLAKAEQSAFENVNLFGLLKEGVSKAQAQQELAAIYDRLKNQHKERYRNHGTPMINTYPMMFMGGGTKPILTSMTVAVAFVLLLACINVANLLYSRANERAKETAIRVALGAPANRLVMQMMWESIIICVLGGVLAFLLAQVGLEITASVMDKILSERSPYFWELTMDPHVIQVSLLIIVATAMVTGVLPAWKILSGDFNQVLRDGTRGAQSQSSSRLNKALVILEVTLSCALLTTSAMISVAIQEAQNTDYGIETQNMLTARVGLPTATYKTPEARTQFFYDLVDELNADPVVKLAIAANPLPGQHAYYRDIDVDGFEKTQDNQYHRAQSAEIVPGAHEGLKIQLLQGRYLERTDDANSQKVAVVTQSFVENVWPNETNIIGKRLRYVADVNQKEFEWMTVVGVVEHVIHGQPFIPVKDRPTIYTSVAQNAWRFVSLGVSGSSDPYEMSKSINKALQKLDTNIPAFEFIAYHELLERNISGMKFISNVFSVFALAALLLAATGIYGVIANSVSLRTQELGIRRALGASDHSVIMMLMKQGWLQLVIGISIGLPIAYVLANAILNFMGDLSFTVYSMMLFMPLTIATVVSFATYVPALRAVSWEPSVALRYE